MKTLSRFIGGLVLLLSFGVGAADDKNAPPSTKDDSLNKYSVVLGYGKVQMTGQANVVCKDIAFRPWNENISASGNLFYVAGKEGDWGHWSILFKEMKPSEGKGKVCMDSGGWGAEDKNDVGAENVFWIVYGH